jgi:hypothetical protein
MSLGDHKQRDQLLYWYIHTMLWGRYAGSTESKLNRDLELIEDTDQPIDNLIQELRQNRGDLSLYASDFQGWSRGARFYPLLYMLTRVWRAKDWETGDQLSQHMLGNLSSLQLHHIFPKSYLYEHNYQRREVNALANMTFLTQETNLHISDRPPIEYLPEIESNQPGVLKSHWIPMDRELWKPENYPAFLVERQKLLANAANEFLQKLKEGKVQDQQISEQPMPQRDESYYHSVDSISSREEERELMDLQEWITKQNLPEGEWGLEILDDEDEPVAFIDLAWPDGLQQYYSEPVALLINEDNETKNAASKAGFRFFTTVEEFKNYVLKEIIDDFKLA